MEPSTKSNRRKNLAYVMVFTVLAAFLLVESLNYHTKTDHDQWKRENYCDAAGYSAYMLMWFEYGYPSKNYPVKIDSTLGYGFNLNGEVIKDKYTCGVSYLQTPFYLINKSISAVIGQDSGPYSIGSRRVIDIAGIFYLLAGCLFLFFFMIKYINRLPAFLSIVMIVGGTNVFYYGVYQPGMSHIYSFFLFSAYLFLADTFFKNPKQKWLIAFAAVGCFIVLIRPTDILFLPIVLFLGKGIKSNIQLILKPVSILTICILAIIVLIPQMHYWYAYSGKIIYYSYENEGFTNLANPQFMTVLFPPENGLFPYSLLLIPLLIANIYVVAKKVPYAIYFLLYQLVALYLIASWHCPDFAAGYGQRNFVQIFAGYSLILGFTLNKLFELRNKLPLLLFLTVSFGCVFMNQRIIYKYDHVYFGRHRWDWREYFYYLNFNQYSSKENFTNYYQTDKTTTINKNNQVLNVLPENEYSRLFLLKCTALPDYYKKANFSAKVNSAEVDFKVCFQLVHHDSILQSFMVPIHLSELKKQHWRKISATFHLDYSYDIPKESGIIIFIWNHQHEQFQMDDAKISIQ